MQISGWCQLRSSTECVLFAGERLSVRCDRSSHCMSVCAGSCYSNCCHGRNWDWSQAGDSDQGRCSSGSVAQGVLLWELVYAECLYRILALRTGMHQGRKCKEYELCVCVCVCVCVRACVRACVCVRA